MIPFLAFLHVGGGLVLVGEILFSSLWLRSSVARGSDLGITRYVLATMSLTSRGVAMPAFAVNLVSGIVLALLDHARLGHAKWLVISIILYTVMAGLWHGRLIPMRKKMQAMIDAVASESLPAGYEAMARQWAGVSGVILTLLALILLLMVWRPAF